MLIRKLLLGTVMGLLFSYMCEAQRKDSDTAKNNVVIKPKKYKDIITDKAISQHGLLTVHQVDNKFYFEVPDSLFNKNILVVSRLEQAAGDQKPASGVGYKGDEIGERVIQFSKGPFNKIYIREIRSSLRSSDSSENGLYKSVLNSNFQPIFASFDIEAYGENNQSTLINITDFLNSDNSVFFFNSLTSTKLLLGLGAIQKDKSYISGVRAYPANVLIHTVKTYSYIHSVDELFSYAISTSLLLLPSNPMHTRRLDERVGYFKHFFLDFDRNPQSAEYTKNITKWRLEPRLGDWGKYFKGELVEPAKPIVFYIDPTTPKKWVPYLIQGVNDWNQAFEKAGFKNAIVGRVAPSIQEDSTWSSEDARFSVIVYKPALIENASGPNVHDPLTGEIIESHVNWYHNVMKLLHEWYFVQAAAIDPKARSMKFDDSLMGELIRFVSSHEIGHALGLRHNFGASSTVPVDSLRKKKWVEDNGFCPSIMDYARFNYVAQPEDSISEKGIFPRIGAYDEWAIEWGYRIFPPFRTDEEERLFLSKWVTRKLQQNKSLWWGDEQQTNDPRCQSEDLGDDASKAGMYGIRNLQRIMPNLINWTSLPGENYTGLRDMYSGILTQYKTYLFHALKNIGGLYINYVTSDQNTTSIGFPDKEKQRRAFKFISDNCFRTPYWLMDRKVYAYGERGSYTEILGVQQSVIQNLLSPNLLRGLLMFETQRGNDAYKMENLLDDLDRSILDEYTDHKTVDLYRRNLQKVYINELIIALNGPSESTASGLKNLYQSLMGITDINSIFKAHLRSNLLKFKIALHSYPDYLTKAHLQDLIDRINNALAIKN